MNSHVLFTDDILLEMKDRGIDFLEMLQTLNNAKTQVLDKDNQVYQFTSKRTADWLTVFDCNPAKYPEETAQYGLMIETDTDGKQFYYHTHALMHGTSV